ncbi:MAG: hypothetical protein GY948_10305 [Alphaproteobacteria bacterium]|nr:hypothetical protein [Alphaproteobacteria bacterium]
MYRLLLVCLGFCSLIGPTLAQTVPESLHVLKGRIIRALAFEPGDPNHILVGQKARKPGSGLVFKSLDGGKTWRTQNANAALNPAATDVQAVAAVSKSLLLAGTWKQGLFVSKNGGRKFGPVRAVANNDIRDFAVTGTTLYAASSQKGVFQSDDKGKTWTAIGPARAALWSITAAGGRLYASSLLSGVFERKGEAWKKISDQDKVYATAVNERAGNSLALAAETGIYIRKKGRWQKAIAGETFADILFSPTGLLIAGSWENGLVVLSPDGRLVRRLLAGKSVVHLHISGERLFAGTWGDGLHILPLNGVLP